VVIIPVAPFNSLRIFAFATSPNRLSNIPSSINWTTGSPGAENSVNPSLRAGP
jgi:hypothetical protein